MEKKTILFKEFFFDTPKIINFVSQKWTISTKMYNKIIDTI